MGAAVWTEEDDDEIDYGKWNVFTAETALAEVDIRLGRASLFRTRRQPALQKNMCFKGRLETVSPSESTELQRKRRSRERIWELATFQGAEVGLRMLQIPRAFLPQNRD